ncbi:hypothetical protein [Streptomyces luteocolor]|uniref:hypothetical protein n=1 Tax=Streptomyces luteocolor TaxID=285500 RepID=UPI00114D03C1|nr:hypothetical protein [Streptomyces luteocolor]
MTGDRPEPWDVSTQAAIHISALMDLFRRACRLQGWTLNEERGLKGWTDVTCGSGHEFRVCAWDIVSTAKPYGLDPGEPLCQKCGAAAWVAECLVVLKSVAAAQGVEIEATDERDESGDGHVVFAAKCSKGHRFKATGRDATNFRGEPVNILCPDCQEAADFAEGFAKIDAVLRETRSTIVKNYRNAADIRCRRGHLHTFRVDSWDDRRAIRPDFCGACDKIAKFQEFSEQAKDLGITVLESQWIAKSRSHQAVCFAGHEFGLVPSKMKRGCPECPRGMYGGTVLPHDVYYVVSGVDATTGEETVKPGISSASGYNRLRQHSEDGLAVQHLRILGLPAGMARVLEKFVLDGLDREGWLSIRGVEYFPSAALQDVMDLAGEWFTDQPGLASRPIVVDVSDVYDVVEAPAAPDVVDVDVDIAVVFDSDDVRAAAALAR